MAVKNLKASRTSFVGQPKAIKKDKLSLFKEDINQDSIITSLDFSVSQTESPRPALTQNLSDTNTTFTFFERELANAGVGKKPSILLANEFIPLKTKDLETLQDLNEAKINFSNGNEISVTNIVRLIELQSILNKQINKISSDHIVKNAPKVIISLNEEELKELKERLYAFYTDVKKHVRDNFLSYFNMLLSKTSLIELIKERIVNGQPQIVSQEFIDSLDPNFLYSLINLVINDIFIFKVNKSIETIANLKDGHEEMISFLRINPSAFSLYTNNFSSFFKDIQNELKNNILTESADGVKKYYLNTPTTDIGSLSQKTNISEYSNLIMKLVSNISFFESISAEEQTNFVYDYNKVNLNSTFDLQSTFNALKTITFPKLISVQNRHPDNKNFEEINSEKIIQILESTNEASRSAQLSELLAGICFDQVVGANKVNSEDIQFTVDQSISTSNNIMNYISSNLLTLQSDYLDTIAPNPSITTQNLDDVISNNTDHPFFKKLFTKIIDQNNSTIPFEIEEGLVTSAYNSVDISHDSFSYFVLRDLIVNKNKDLNIFKNYLNDHKVKLENILRTFTKTFSLGFKENGGNASALEAGIQSTTSTERRAQVNANRNPAVANSKVNYVLGNLNPMSFLNYYLEILANDLNVMSNPQISISSMAESAISDKFYFSILASAYAGASVEDSLKSFKASFLGTLTENESFYLFEEDKDTSVETAIAGDLNKKYGIYNKIAETLNSEVYKSFSELMINLFSSNEFSEQPDRYPLGTTNGYYVRDVYDNLNTLEIFNALIHTGNIFGSSIKATSFQKITENQVDATDLQTYSFPSYSNGRGMKKLFMDIYKFFPSSARAGASRSDIENKLYDDNPSFTSEEMEYSDVGGTLNGIGSRKIGNGVNITYIGKLPQALLYNYAVLNKSSLENQNLKFPNVQNLGINKQKKLIKGGYFEKGDPYPRSENATGLSDNFYFKAKNSRTSRGTINTSNLHLYLVFHMWALNLINKSIHVELGSTNQSLAIKISQGNIDGLVAALKNKELEGNESESFVSAYNTANQLINQLKEKILKRNQLILKTLFPIQHQIEKINKYIIKIDNVLNNTPENILTDMQNFLDPENFNIPFKSTSIRYSNIDYQKSFVLNKEYFPMTNNNLLESEKNDLRIMYKILTSPGQGFFKTSLNSNKKIYHVGISSVLYQNLQIQAGEKSNLVCIIVNRINQIDINEKSLPKYYIFDMSKYVLPKYYNDENKEITISNHIENFADDNSYSALINSIEFLEINNKVLKSVGTGPEAFLSNDNLTGITNGVLEGNYSEAAQDSLTSNLQKNHILDYYLKLYTKATIEIESDESNYPLRNDIFEENTVDDNPYAINFNTRVMNSVKSNLESLSELDENISQQTSRVQKNILSSPLFNSQARAENNIYNSGLFDRTFSLLLDEEDFILENQNGTITADGNHSVSSTSTNENKNSVYSFTFQIALLRRW